MKEFKGFTLETFEGTYNTWYDYDSYAIQDEDEQGNEIEDSYYPEEPIPLQDIASEYSTAWFVKFQDTFDIKGEITNLRATSPTYYNYSTDEIIIDFKIDDYDKFKETLLNKTTEHYAILEAAIKRKFTSRDGFWSFMPNNISEWIDKIDEDTDDMRYWSVLCAEIMLIENDELRVHLYYETMDNLM